MLNLETSFDVERSGIAVAEEKLQPHAVIFSDAGPDVRWCGNENGTAGEPNWSTVDPSRWAKPRWATRFTNSTAE